MISSGSYERSASVVVQFRVDLIGGGFGRHTSGIDIPLQGVAHTTMIDSTRDFPGDVCPCKARLGSTLFGKRVCGLMLVEA